MTGHSDLRSTEHAVNREAMARRLERYLRRQMSPPSPSSPYWPSHESVVWVIRNPWSHDGTFYRATELAAGENVASDATWLRVAELLEEEA